MGAPMLLTMGLSGTPSLCILGSLYNLGGLEPAGPSCPFTSLFFQLFLPHFLLCSSYHSTLFYVFTISFLFTYSSLVLFLFSFLFPFPSFLFILLSVIFMYAYFQL